MKKLLLILLLPMLPQAEPIQRDALAGDANLEPYIVEVVVKRDKSSPKNDTQQAPIIKPDQC